MFVAKFASFWGFPNIFLTLGRANEANEGESG
jgi:hypothetical protein